MERHDDGQICPAERIVKHHRRGHHDFPLLLAAIAQHRDAEIQMPVIRAGDDFIVVQRVNFPSADLITHRVTVSHPGFGHQFTRRRPADPKGRDEPNTNVQQDFEPPGYTRPGLAWRRVRNQNNTRISE